MGEQLSTEPQKISRRGFLGKLWKGSVAGGVAATGVVKIAEANDVNGETSRENEVIQMRKEIEEVWGFKCVSDGTLSFDQQYEAVKNIRDSLGIYPPGINTILAESTQTFWRDKPKFIVKDIDDPENVEVKVNGRTNTFTNEILIDFKYGTDYETIDHEIAHIIHSIVKAPEIEVDARYLGDAWDSPLEMSSDFDESYSLRNKLENFAVTAQKLFKSPRVMMEVLRDVNSEESFKVQTVINAYSVATHGLMDKQFFQDFAEGKVDGKYWATKIPSEEWKKAVGNTKMMVTDLDKISDQLVPGYVMSVKHDEYIQGEDARMVLAEKGIFNIPFGDKQISVESLGEGLVIVDYVTDNGKSIILSEKLSPGNSTRFYLRTEMNEIILNIGRKLDQDLMTVELVKSRFVGDNTEPWDSDELVEGELNRSDNLEEHANFQEPDKELIYWLSLGMSVGGMVLSYANNLPHKAPDPDSENYKKYISRREFLVNSALGIGGVGAALLFMNSSLDEAGLVELVKIKRHVLQMYNRENPLNLVALNEGIENGASGQ